MDLFGELMLGEVERYRVLDMGSESRLEGMADWDRTPDAPRSRDE